MGENGGINLYCFVTNNGIIYFDPLGLRTITIPGLSVELKEKATDLASHYSAAQQRSLANGDSLGYLFNSLNTVTYGIASLVLPENEEEFFIGAVTLGMGPVIVNATKYAGPAVKSIYYKVFRKCGDDLVEVSDDVGRKIIKEFEDGAGSNSVVGNNSIKLLPAPDAPNLTNVTSVRDLMTRIPDNAQRLPWQDVPGGAKQGIKWRWTDSSGNKWAVRAHEMDPGAPLGTNASKGWIYRVEINPSGAGGRWFMDSSGSFNKRNVLNVNSPHYNEVISNDTHIPLYNN